MFYPSEDTQLYLRNHAHLCRQGRYYVIMDLRHDLYLCIERFEFEALTRWLAGWQASGTNASLHAVQPDSDPRQLARQLIDRGILSESSAAGRPVQPLALERPHRELRGTPGGGKLDLSKAPSFACSALRAHILLKHSNIEKTVRSVERSKLAASPSGPLEEDRIVRLVHGFNALRSLFPRNYLCLFDSLALLLYLFRQGVFPSWVFGVMADPFAAHCWLQTGDLVLNDSLERVSHYTPIMAV